MLSTSVNAKNEIATDRILSSIHVQLLDYSKIYPDLKPDVREAVDCIQVENVIFLYKMARSKNNIKPSDLLGYLVMMANLLPEMNHPKVSQRIKDRLSIDLNDTESYAVDIPIAYYIMFSQGGDFRNSSYESSDLEKLARQAKASFEAVKRQHSE